MTDHNQKSHSLAAAAIGVVVGAGVAVAGAVALKDKKNRDKVEQVLADVKDQTVEYLGKLQKNKEKTTKMIKEKIK